MSACKFYKEKKQESYDDGLTWSDVIPYQYQKGDLYETDSSDCYNYQRWVPVQDGYICEDGTKYQKERLEGSFDGSDYSVQIPPVYRKGSVIEYDSRECLYKFYGTYRTEGTYDPYKIVLCYNNSHILTDEEINESLGHGSLLLTHGYIGRCVDEINADFRVFENPDTQTGTLTVRDITIEAIAPPRVANKLYLRGDYPIYVPCISYEAYLDADEDWDWLKEKVHCIGSVPQFKYVIVNTDLTTYSATCDSTSAITSSDVPDKEHVLFAVVGNCSTSISASTFSGCSNLTGITIYDNVSEIGAGAFNGCSGLTRIKIPDGVTYIQNSTFRNCTNLKRLNSTADGVCNIPSGVTSIGAEAFQNCKSFSSVTIPDSVTYIGSYAFLYCNGLTKINSSTNGVCNIPDSVTSIGSQTFAYCSGFSGLTIGSGITSIGSWAFYGNTNLSGITINAKTPPSLGSYAFESTNNCPIYVPCEAVGRYIEDVTWSNYVSRLRIVSTYKTDCLSLIGISPDGYTFEHYCNEDLTLNGTDINNYATAIIGDCVRIISAQAFVGTRNTLTSVTISDSVYNIGREAFSGCTGLTTITIPSGVTTIGTSAFRNCSGLTSITVMAETPPSLSSYAFRNTNDCPIYVPCDYVNTYKAASGWSTYASRIQAIPGSCPFTGKWLATYTGGTTSSAECGSSSAINQNEITLTDLVSVEIGDCVTNIGYRAFYQCSSLTSVTIPDSVTRISDGAFRSCSGLASVTIPDSVTSIGELAFYGCSSLTTCTIGSGVTSIDYVAFYNCSGLTSITVNATTPPSLGSFVFNGSTCPIYVPAASVSTYQSASGWSEYASRIVSIEDKFTGKWLVTDSGGTTTSAECDSTSAITRYEISVSGIVSAEIGDCVKVIGDQSFEGCRSLSSVTMPYGVEHIGYFAFHGCESLTSVTIPNSVISFGLGAFAGCGLTSINIPSSVINIGESAFGGISLSSITVDSNNRYYSSEDGVLFNKAKTTLLEYPLGNTRASYSAPNSVTSISDGAFMSCRNITNVTIPDSVTSIGKNVFYNCTNLTNLTIGSGVTSIGMAAFEDCSGLTSVTVNAITPPTLGSYAFDNTNYCTIYVPAASVSTYKSTGNWKLVSSRIQAIP